jgi:hypothetical protein
VQRGAASIFIAARHRLPDVKAALHWYLARSQKQSNSPACQQRASISAS